MSDAIWPAIWALSIAVICLAAAQVIMTLEFLKWRRALDNVLRDLDILFEGATYLPDWDLWVIKRSK